MLDRLLIATNNKNKLAEIKSLFKDLGIKIVSLSDLNINHEVDETGKTFKENAILKAEEYCNLSSMVTLADDSGIEVDALGGKPGVYSARYAGKNCSDLDNQNKLLHELKGVASSNRTARFVSVFALKIPNGKVYTTKGCLEGVITEEPYGDNGFGYDPIFFIPKFNATAAQITQQQKNCVSHRGEALRKVLPILTSLQMLPQNE